MRGTPGPLGRLWVPDSGEAQTGGCPAGSGAHSGAPALVARPCFLPLSLIQSWPFPFLPSTCV